jgi:hypothetical protein
MDIFLIKMMGWSTPLFAELPKQMEFECIKSEVLLNALVQTQYRRKKTTRNVGLSVLQ